MLWLIGNCYFRRNARRICDLNAAMFTAVTEVDRKADRQPDDEPDPGVERQADHHQE